MNITVCFKVHPDPDRVLPEDWEHFSPDRDLSYAGLDFNCFDGSALELALQLKEEVTQEPVFCRALTFCGELPRSFVSRLYSIGFDEVTVLTGKQPEFCPEAVAEALAAEAAGADLILTGRETCMGETGMVPYLLGEKLHMPVHGNVERLSWKENRLQLFCRREEGLAERREELPLIAAVSNSPAVLRAATLRKQLQCRGRTAVCKPAAASAVSGETPVLRRSETERSCTMLDPGKPETWQQLRTLLQTAAGKTQSSENQTPQLLHRAVEEGRLHLFPDTGEGREAAVRLAAQSLLPCVFGGEITALDESRLHVRKSAFGGNLLWERELSLPAVLTGEFGDLTETVPRRRETMVEPAEQTGLREAALVLLCGNGMGSREACEKARCFAGRIGGGFGLTRPAVLNGWGRELVGQSGLILEPRVCVTMGAAGAGAFYLGIEKAQTVVAVNTDPNALIFRRADYGLLMDAGAFLAELQEEWT